MIDDKEMIEIIRKRVTYFWENKIKIHTTLKTNKWYNGIISDVSDEFFILEDFKEGEIVIFFIEIFPNGINEYREEGVDGN